jgi:SAM-dependent methyltransferase
MATWHEDDDFWTWLAPVMFSPRRLGAAAREVESIISLIDLPHGSTILDMCTGPGRHAVELALRGHRVIGVDRTQAFLDRAAAEARARDVADAVELVRGDMRAFVRPSAFDAVLNLYTSFGYFEDAAAQRTVAANALACLAPGAPAVFEMMGREVLARIFRGRWWTEVDGCLVCEERVVRDGWTHLESRWIVVRGGERREFSGVQRIYSGCELRETLLHAGFDRVELYGTLDGAPYDHQADRLVAVAWRPR